jgi:hypothetical protein
MSFSGLLEICVTSYQLFEELAQEEVKLVKLIFHADEVILECEFDLGTTGDKALVFEDWLQD